MKPLHPAARTLRSQNHFDLPQASVELYTGMLRSTAVPTTDQPSAIE
jgi:hypothetical protein